MSERLSSPEGPRGRFERPRDAVLYALTLSGWASESCGRVDSPYGWNAWLSNSEHELPDLLGVLGELTEEAGLTDTHELVGFWLLHEGNEGFVDVFGYETEDELRSVYAEIEAQVAVWEQDAP